jgi:HAD superfamily hydrolase (TIGR01509 family)
MNKLLIFDLDGVLADTREIHYHALNEALEEILGKKAIIDRDTHLSQYDGLPTTVKLKKLKIDPSYHNDIWLSKQDKTEDLIDKQIVTDLSLIRFCKKLEKKGIKLACCSNSIRSTIIRVLEKLGIYEYMHVIVSNEDVINNKPHPEMFWNAMANIGTIPEKTVILEDSHIGRLAAIRSGAILREIQDANCLKNVHIQNEIIDMLKDAEEKVSVPWNNSNLNVVIPMAGNGTRFAQKGYSFPKPLIDVKGVPMIEAVVNNLNIKANYIFIAKSEHIQKYNLNDVIQNMMKDKAYNVTLVEQDHTPVGAACTVLLAKEYINNDSPILIANSDQIFEWNSNECMYAFKHEEIDGGILTFKNSHPKWSYAEMADNGFVKRVAEKVPLPGNHATVGVYYWQRGSDFVRYAEQMIKKDIRVNNEFYVCPVFNEAIADGKKIRVKSVDKMWGIGTPEDLEEYLRHE